LTKPLREVKDYWEKSPIFDYEVKEERFSRAYYEKVDDIYFNENNRFNIHLFHFGDCKGKTVLEIGFGAGAAVRRYARSGARIYAVDLAEISVQRAHKSLQLFNLKGNLLQSDAAFLPFRGDSFDYVLSFGVLHHLPSTEAGIQEVHRVLKPGGKALIALYYKHVLLQNAWLFSLFRMGLRLLLRAPQERRGLQFAETPEEFVRMYDGPDNPIGRVYTREEIKDLFKAFRILNIEQHGAPVRFLLGSKYLPVFLHRLIDRYFGLCLCVEAEKS
jgi:ubiquinone/menaquinone biosynthesis C-methylase UbiE